MSNRVVTMKGNPLTLQGAPVQVGDKAPDFNLVATDLSPVSLASFAGKALVICAVPSLDTSVCDLEMQRFNSEAARLGDDVSVLCVSADLPFAQSRWCGAKEADAIVPLSDYKEASFGTAWGVLIAELRLLARAVFVVDRQGVVRYAEVVPELTQEPDYAAALAAVAALA